MSIRYDEKGKFFTDIITKDTVPSIIQTLVTRIQGSLHVRVNERVKDELNRGEQFLAITDATIFNLQGQKIYQAEFLLVNRDHVIWIIPDDENSPQPTETDGEA
ncbi:MAG TPA: hypothetical protein DEH22_16310 [Chloroflexi bacterium]|nr:hypothetical protein [Chloroflexota bacterium]